MKTTLRFFRQNNKWYADVAGHTLEENEMVMGSEVMLEMLANGRNNISLILSDKPEKIFYLPIVILTRKEHDEDGAFYNVEVLTPIFTDILSEIWICNVTHDVFGEHPEEIYIYGVK